LSRDLHMRSMVSVSYILVAKGENRERRIQTTTTGLMYEPCWASSGRNLLWYYTATELPAAAAPQSLPGSLLPEGSRVNFSPNS
jgi:hypothetical protein